MSARTARTPCKAHIETVKRPVLRAVVQALLLGAAGVTVATAASFELPPVNSPATTEHHVGKVVWADLVTPNLDAAEKFYGGLFGWTFQAIRAGDSDYVVAQLAGHPVAGIVEKPVGPSQRHQSAWLTFIAVRDVDAAKRNAVAHRAKVLTESVMYANRGRQAVLADPEGAVFALLASTSGDPPDELADPGEWIWSSLHVKDPGAEAAFYQNVFGYDVFDNSEGASEHLLLSSDDYARASANPLPAAGKRHAHWLNFVRVTDAKDAAARATTLGGRVLVEPHVDRQGSTVAVVADPAGAAVGLLQWDPTDAPSEAK